AHELFGGVFLPWSGTTGFVLLRFGQFEGLRSHKCHNRPSRDESVELIGGLPQIPGGIVIEPSIHQQRIETILLRIDADANLLLVVVEAAGQRERRDREQARARRGSDRDGPHGFFAPCTIASIAAASRGRRSVRFSRPSGVTSTSSSMRTPMRCHFGSTPAVPSAM